MEMEGVKAAEKSPSSSKNNSAEISSAGTQYSATKSSNKSTVLVLDHLLLRTHQARTNCVGPLSVVLFLLGLVWVSLLGSICVTTGELKPRGTYVSDNSIMPATAMTQVSSQDVEEAAHAVSIVANVGRGGNRLFSHLEPLGAVDLAVYGGLLRSKGPASDRRETICLVAEEGRGEDILLALSKSLSKAQWLSKDILFIVIPQTEPFQRNSATVDNALRRYLEAYQLNALDDSIARSGPIRGAVVIDLPATAGRRNQPALTRETLLVQGINGRLPNMDLINTARITAPSFASGQQSFFDSLDTDGSMSKSVLGLKFARDVLSGPNGWHGEFLRLGIDSITIKASPSSSSKSRGSEATKVEFAQRVERMVRSLNTMSEKFNRSFYFYVMLGIDSFVSIEEFLWALILFISPLCIDSMYTALAPNKEGFKETIRALGRLGLALFIGSLAVIVNGSMLPTGNSLVAIWTASFCVFWISSRSSTPQGKSLSDVDKVAELDPWRYRRAANEVFVFVLCTALGVGHFPLAMATAILCMPCTRLSTPLSTQQSVYNGLTSVASLSALLMATWLLFTQDVVPFQSSGLVHDISDIRMVVLFLVVLPSHLMVSDVLLFR